MNRDPRRIAALEEAAARKKAAADAYWRGESGTPLRPLAGALAGFARRIDPEDDERRLADVRHVAELVAQVAAGEIDPATLVACCTAKQRFRYCAAFGFSGEEAKTLLALVPERGDW